MRLTSKIIFLMCFSVFSLIACSNEKNVQEGEKEMNDNVTEIAKGNWKGAIDLGQPLMIEMSFDETLNTLSIPVQQLYDAPIHVKVNRQTMQIDADVQGQKLVFEGEVENDKIAGTFTQAGKTYPFTLERVVAKIGEPFSVSVQDNNLNARLMLPEGSGPFPVIIIIAGSGPTDMDGNSDVIAGRNDSLKMVAQLAVEQNVAVIRYDKRGVGENRHLLEREEDVTFDYFVQDAQQLVKWAQQDDRFSTVGIVGHSEGSIIGSVVADQEKTDFFVSLTGPGRPYDELILEQLHDQLPAELYSQAEKIFADLKEGKQVKQVSPQLQALFRPSVQPFLISALRIDPAKVMAKLQQPVLIVGGGRDLQVPKQDAVILKEALPSATMVYVETMNHVLKESPVDGNENMATYSNPNLPLDPQFKDALLTFIKTEVLQ